MQTALPLLEAVMSGFGLGALLNSWGPTLMPVGGGWAELHVHAALWR